jgi:hypothetical protein
MREIFDDNLSDLKWLPPVRFKGGSTTTQSRTIPNQTAEEAAIQKNVTNYANTAMGSANNLFPAINNLTNSNNINSLYKNYQNTANNVNAGYGNLINGNLPSTYAANRQQALSSDLTGTVGNTLNNLGSRGILNSSVTTGALDNISKNASDTLARNYASDLNSYSGLLGNTSVNNSKNLTDYTSLLGNLVGNSNQLANNSSDLFNTMYSGRMGTGTTQSTTSGGNNGTAGMIGQLGAAAILCFVAGTQIATPNGNKKIEDIKLGDEVYSIDKEIETVVEVQEPCISPNDYMIVITPTKSVRPTSTQPFITTDGDVLATELVGKELVGFKHNEKVVAVLNNPNKETVYDFKTTGSNTYFANGFGVRGM